MAQIAVFEQLFEILDDGRVAPKVWVQIKGLKFGPGAHFPPDFRPDGHSPEEWRGCTMWCHREGDVIVIDLIEKQGVR